jgi:hypothetical protein
LSNLNEFPDAWMSLDAQRAGFRLANYCAIKAEHIQGGSNRVS